MSDLLNGLAPWPTGDFSVFGDVEVDELPRIQRFVAANMGRNWIAIPHVTHHDDADITALEEARRAHNDANGTKLTIVPLLVKILADALVAFPQFNQSLDPAAGKIIRKKFAHVGVAVDTPKGLLVPVVRDCNKKDAGAIAGEIAALSAKAREKGLTMDEMSGGCITLSSLGHIGGTAFTPIVNAPEVAILGVTRARPVATPGIDGGVAWKTMLPLSLSYDHRVINGADAARFVAYVAGRLVDSTSLF
ncbi:2-oxo acid dehydrogenase subunit E2 [Sphingopyxis sp. JAI128]|uniref:2-oxo acid dehydrogenase subunit E2 n=1 Tax=Sphingopyxis sp. JAI128 TaxID=2723066 RepID=UPI001617D612|nr:2-oxo acid dehydrogenase subunit E2 [Sphingopyxis sp. JAI128]MBB6426845.1 pyruvate dehydrogenase E2 component (dihydrolipoamide acetyltransferase) [Sphingopyxis sp. JAI128]